MLDHQINWLLEHGANRIVLAIDQNTYLSYISKSYNISKKVYFSVETEKLGTCYAVRKASELLSKPEFYLMNVDDFITSNSYNPNQLLNNIQDGEKGTVLITRTFSPFGILEINERHILQFKEKPILDYWVNTGHIAFNRKFVQNYFPIKGNLDLILSSMSEQRQLAYLKLEGEWFTVNNLKQLEFAYNKIQKIQSNLITDKIIDYT